MSEAIKRAARATREEIVRQYRDDERGKCPAGAAYYEEYIAPGLIATACIETLLDPSEAAVVAVAQAIERSTWDNDADFSEAWVSPDYELVRHNRFIEARAAIRAYHKSILEAQQNFAGGDVTAC